MPSQPALQAPREIPDSPGMRTQDVLKRAGGATFLGMTPLLLGGGTYGVASQLIPFLWAVAAASAAAFMSLTVVGAALVACAVESLPGLTDD